MTVSHLLLRALADPADSGGAPPLRTRLAAAAPGATSRRGVVCTVNHNGVAYRSGPGPQYPALGMVNQGQNMDSHARRGSWRSGDLWGGPAGVWISTADLDC
ncbi:SH3 domain-containing protein [Kitasatospora sp. NPDC050543]|uniref:SH3 domain-containing protein n=1 Tax=Kitasatospora sp. NPDC050543 TaxID=3364054 RepID=UPI0037894647